MPKAEFDRAKRDYPSWQMGEVEWLEFFGTSEGQRAMGRIIGDIFEQVKTDEDRERGIRRMGRRPKREGFTVDDVFAVVFPNQWSMDTFPLAFKKLVGERSTRQFAPKVPCAQSTIVRLLSGELRPDMQMMEAVARAAKVEPTYFLEYRGLYAAEFIRRVMDAQPHFGIQVVKELRRAMEGAA